MTPTLNEPAEREAFQSYWCPPDHDETRGFEVHKQFARDAWLARARIAAEREAELVKDAERLAAVKPEQYATIDEFRAAIDAAVAQEAAR